MAKSKTGDMPKGKTEEKTKKKLSRSTKFAILTACLLLAVCGYGAAVKLATNTSDEEAENEISFVDINEEDVVSISWKYDGETYTLTKTDEGAWVRTDEEDFELEQDTVNSMVAAASNITASRMISGVTDFAQYGLNDSQSRITITYATAALGDSEASAAANSAATAGNSAATSTSGTSSAGSGTSAVSGTSGTVTLEILTGDLSDVSGEYYARIAGSDTVYMVYGEYLEYFECSADELAAAEEE